MDKINGHKHYLSLRKSLVVYIIVFVVLALVLSVVTFSLCDRAAESIRSSYPPPGEKYYLTNKHTYRIERDQNKISYKEYINNKNIKSLSWSTDSLEVEILYRTNDKPRSFKKLHSELVASAINRNKSIPDEISLKKSLEFLYNEGLVYYDKSFDASNGENYFENIVSVIVIFYPETTN